MLLPLLRIPFMSFLLCCLTCILFMPALQAANAQKKLTPLKLGATLPLTGKYATNGKAMAQGYRFMIEAFNKVQSDQKNSFQIELIIKDNQSVPSRGARLAETLIRDDKVIAMLGPFSSGVIEAMAPLAATHKIPLILGNLSSSQIFQSDNPYLFSVSTPAEKLFDPLIAYYADQPDLPRIAMAFMEDPYSMALYNPIVRHLSLIKAELVEQQIITSNFSDLSDLLVSAQANKAQLLLFSAHARGAAILMRTAEDLKLDLPQIAMTHCQAAQIHLISPKYSEKIICPVQWHTELTYKDAIFGDTQGFAEAYKQDYGLFPSIPVAQSAAAALTLLNALSQVSDRKNLLAQIQKTKLESFYGPISFDSTGQNRRKPAVLLQIQSGKYRPVFPISAVPYTFQYEDK